MACTITEFSSNIKNLTLVVSNPDHRRLIRHLYRRIGYGASLADLDFAHNKSIDTLVNELIDSIPFDENAPDSFNSAANIPFPEEAFEWINRIIDFPKRSTSGDDVNPIIADTYDDMMIGYWINESIIEGVRGKLMLFWHNHFVTGATGHDKTYAMLRYFKILFENAFGDFKEFTKAIGRTPRMLKYLNGDENTVILSDGTYSGPNENYARELLELFTMGIKDEYNKNGVDNYSPEDISKIGRALTGWRVASNNNLADEMPAPDEFRFQYGRHDWSGKTFLGVSYDSKWTNGAWPNTQAIVMDTIANSNIAAGEAEYDQVHEIVFGQRANQIAYFICEKLYKFYIYAGLDAEDFQGLTNPPNNPTVKNIHTYIKELADQFSADWNIANLLKTIFKSKHFYDEGVIGGQIKSHVESAVSFFHTAALEPSNWAATSDGKTSEITNLTTYDYKYRLGLLEPHLHETPSQPLYTVQIQNQPVILSNDNHVTGSTVNAITGERGIPHDVYKGIFRPHHPARIAAACKDIGQEVLNPPHVAGWSGHHSWLNEYTLIKRRELLESYLTAEPFTDDPATYYNNTKYGFRLVTKKKFLALAKELIDLEYAIPSYTNPEQVVEVLWKHFFCVTRTQKQLDDAKDVIAGINVNPGENSLEQDEMALLITDLLVHFIRQPEYQLT